jgi:hypothetical protein
MNQEGEGDSQGLIKAAESIQATGYSLTAAAVLAGGTDFFLPDQQSVASALWHWK